MSEPKLEKSPSSKTFLSGGKLLAEGGYGCVFSPGINCNGTSMKNKKYVSKIQRYDSSAKNEIKIGKKIEELSGFEDHFVPVLKHCEIDIANIEDNEKDKCSIFKKSKTKDYIVMKSQYIEGEDFMDYLINQKNSVQLVSNIILSFNHLLKSLTMLESKFIVHYDLKGTNILYNVNKEIPLLIDFGLSVNMQTITNDKLKSIFYVYAPEYYIWPLETHYLCYLINKNKEPDSSELTDIVETYVDNNKALQKNFSPNFLKKYKEKCMRQLEMYNELSFDERVKKILKYWKTFDNYSLSIMYLKFLYYININGFIDNKFIIFLSKLLLQNIDPNPDKRLSLIETMHTFNTFLYQKNINNVKTFEELTGSFIDNKKNVEAEIVKDKKNNLFETKTMRVQRRKSLAS
jgi:serine/threonine protein kinase